MRVLFFEMAERVKVFQTVLRLDVEFQDRSLHFILFLFRFFQQIHILILRFLLIRLGRRIIIIISFVIAIDSRRVDLVDFILVLNVFCKPDDRLAKRNY